MILFIKIFSIIICFIFNNNIFSNYYLIRTNISYKHEIKNIELYLKFCKDLKTIHKFKKKNPKISIISPIYNREKFIPRFIGCLQNQSFKDIEIILVDDNSSDNSAKLIEKYKKEDKRIILIKNNKNRGTFITRNIGVLKSKAKYVIIPDPDDILSKEIIGICYEYGEKYNYDIIKFNMYGGNGKVLNENYDKFNENRPIYQPELSTYIYYGNYELEQIDYYIADKFIKKKVYIESLNSLNNFYLNMFMTSMEDDLMNFLLHRTAKSFYFLKQIGYLYKRTNESISRKLLLISQIRLKFIFIELKFIFEFSKNSKFEKDMVNHRLTKILKFQDIAIERLLSNINFNKDFYFYYEVINTLINCPHTSKVNTNILKKFKNIILQKKRNNLKS